MNLWSSEEIKLLTTIYQSSEYTIEEISNKLPGRSINSIRLKASRLGLKRPDPIQLECCPMCGRPFKDQASVLEGAQSGLHTLELKGAQA